MTTLFVDNIVFLLLQDDENAQLSAKMKELEEDRARLQKTTNIQQTQIEKHRALAQESDKKCDGLQAQVSALHKVCQRLTIDRKISMLSQQQTVKCDTVFHYSCVITSWLCSVQEIENLNRSQKQAAGVHSTVEVRLNRASEEVERLKTQLNKMKQMNKVSK